MEQQARLELSLRAWSESFAALTGSNAPGAKPVGQSSGGEPSAQSKRISAAALELDPSGIWPAWPIAWR